jgi:hypothetical protein
MREAANFVDDKVIDDVKDWLVTRRTDEGRFSLNPKQLDNFGGATQDISDAYIVWSLTQQQDFSYEDLKKEFENLEKISQETKDTYFLGLYSAALFNVGKKDQAVAISERVVRGQNDTGAVEGAMTSITSSLGESLVLETTAIAVINWIDQDMAKFSKNVERGIEFISSKIKDGGRFGSTQSTVLSLKALVRYAQFNQGLRGAGDLVLYLNGERVGQL